MKFKKELFKYLSELSGLDIIDKIFINSFSDTYQLKYTTIDNEEYKLGKRYLKGNIPAYTLNQCNTEIKTLPIDFVFDNMYYKVHKSINDFGIEYTVDKSLYKYDEGNGWHSMQNIININNEQFVNI